MAKRKNRKAKASKRAKLFKFKGLDGKEYGLTILQKKFCDNYLEQDASGVDAVIEAGYKCEYKNGATNRRLASSIASENLCKPNIIAYINKKLDEYGFNDQNIETQHWFLINQMADLTNKRKAIDMYYKRFGKYAPEQHEHKIKEVKVIDFSDE